MDALETYEGNLDLPYRSTSKASHLCGHDGHISALLGGVCLFLDNIDSIPQDSRLRLIF